MTEPIPFTPEAYSIKYQDLDDYNAKNKKTLRGVSKVVVKMGIHYDDFINVLTNNEIIRKK
jgi:hypothetical protein